MLIHLTARTDMGRRPFTSAEHCWWLWSRLRESFPVALAACLMLEHLHLLLSTRDADAERFRLARLLGAFSRYQGRDARWITADPVVIPDRHHLARQIRYVHLNPCRANLIDDPLAHTWSTHRGLVGAEVDPWVTPDRIAPLLGRSTEGFAIWLHGYVSGDSSVNPAGTPFPKPAPSRSTPVVPLERIVNAAFAATPWSSTATQRRVAAQLARHQGWKNDAVLSSALSMTPQALGRSAKKADQNHLAAATLCLGDARLIPAHPRGIEIIRASRVSGRARAKAV